MKKWLAILMVMAFASISQAQVVDAWHYDGLGIGAEVGMSSAASTGIVGGVTFADKVNVAITNEMVKWIATGAANENYFNANDLSSSDGENAGEFQLELDFVSADFSLTSASNTDARVGINLRNQAGGNKDCTFRVRFDGRDNVTNIVGAVTNVVDYDEFSLEVKDSVVNWEKVASIPGSTLNTNLHIRMVYDLDNSGSAGSFQVYYTYGAAAEVAAYTNGTLHAAYQIDQIRWAAQMLNGGAGWQVGDEMYTDNLVVTKLVAPPVMEYGGNLTIVDSKTGTHNTTPTNYTYKTFADAQEGDVVVVLQAANKGYDPDSSDSTGVITFGGTASLSATTLNRVAIGGAPSANWYATVTNAGSVAVNLNHTNSWQAIGAYLVRSDTDEIEIIATDANSATDPAAVTNVYDFGGTITGLGLFFEATAGNDAAGPTTSNGDTIFDVGSSSRQIARGEISGGSALTNIWTMTTATKRTGVAGVVLAGVGTSPTVTVDEWDMDSNGQYQLSNNSLILPNSDTNVHQFAQTADDGTFIFATTNTSAYSGKTTLSEPVVLSNNVATMTLKLTGLDWSTNEAANTSFGIRLWDGGANYVGLKVNDQGGVSNTRISCEDSDGDNGNYGRLSTNMVVSSSHTITLELDYANSEIRLSGNWEWSPDGISGVQTNSFDFAGKGITQLTQIQTRAANWSAGDFITLDNLLLKYTPVDEEPPAPDTPTSLYGDWVDGKGWGSNTNLLEDGDSDGVNNLVDYAIGGVANLAVPAIDGSYLQYIHVQWDAANATARGLSYEVQATGDLAFPTWSTNDVEFVGSVDGIPEAGYTTVTNRIPTTDDTEFVKLNITFTP